MTFEGAGYFWHGGYWGRSAGYYGGLNYGYTAADTRAALGPRCVPERNAPPAHWWSRLRRKTPDREAMRRRLTER